MGAMDDFYARVSRAVRRGDTYDADIIEYTADAVRDLENVHEWAHMWKLDEGKTLAAAASSLVVPATGVVKSVDMLRFYRYVDAAQTQTIFAYAKKIHPESAGGNAPGQTTQQVPGFWVENRTTLRLTGTFADAQTYDAGWYEFSVIDDSLPWLTIAPGLLLAAVMVNTAPLLRDDRALARWNAIFEGRLAAAENSDLVHRYGGTSESMQPFTEDVADALFSSDDGWG